MLAVLSGSKGAQRPARRNRFSRRILLVHPEKGLTGVLLIESDTTTSVPATPEEVERVRADLERRRAARLLWKARAPQAQKWAGHKHRIRFVSVGEVPRTPGPVVGVMLMGNGWTDAEREAALQEDAELARRFPEKYGDKTPSDISY